MPAFLNSRSFATFTAVILIYAAAGHTVTASSPVAVGSDLSTASHQRGTRRGRGPAPAPVIATPAATPPAATPVSTPGVDLAAQASAFRLLVRAAIAQNVRLGAGFLRLAFHDAFTVDPATRVGGANGSIRFELGQAVNNGLQGALDALAPLQAQTGLGWGDAVAVAGAEAVSAAGGPTIPLRLGRATADAADPAGILPDRSDSLAQLRAAFAPRGFTDTDLVALCGAHSLGRVGNQPFVSQSTVFQNDYFINLKWFVDQQAAGLSDTAGPPITPNFQLESDLALISEAGTTAIVEQFAVSEQAFFASFVIAYQKMTDSGF